MTFWQEAWAKIKAVFRWIGVNLLAPGVALIVVVGAILLVAMGAKDLQIGGLLAKLLGKKGADARAVDVANTVPPDRVDAKGNLIPPGTPDDRGHKQAVVVPIEEPGLFSDPTVVVVTPPGAVEPIEVELPKGVEAKDVEQVVVVAPGKFVVTVKDSAPIPTQSLDDLLKKYGG